jgi:hypothetical protein
VTPLALLATETPAGIPGWLWPLAVAGGGSIILAVIGGVWALIRYAVPRWVRETVKPASDRPSPMPQALTQTGGSSVYRDLGAHGATLEALGEGQREIRDVIAAGQRETRDALSELRTFVADSFTLHHGRIAVVESIVGVTPIHTGDTGRHPAATDPTPPLPVRQRTQSRGERR